MSNKKGVYFLVFLRKVPQSLMSSSFRKTAITYSLKPFTYPLKVLCLCFNNCLMDVRCPNSTTGTINVGNQLKGKFKSAMFGCSNASFCNGEGADKKANATMLSNLMK